MMDVVTEVNPEKFLFLPVQEHMQDIKFSLFSAARYLQEHFELQVAFPKVSKGWEIKTVLCRCQVARTSEAVPKYTSRGSGL